VWLAALISLQHSLRHLLHFVAWLAVLQHSLQRLLQHLPSLDFFDQHAQPLSSEVPQSAAQSAAELQLPPSAALVLPVAGPLVEQPLSVDQAV
jgi:hypothetical protein